MRKLVTVYLATPTFWVSSSAISFILFALRWKRAVILKNIELCGLPKTHFSFLRYYFRATMDVLQFLTGLRARPIVIRGVDKKKLAFLKQNGGLILSAHFNNWELMGSFLQVQGLNLLSYAKPLKNQFWDRILSNSRSRFKNKTIHSNLAKTAVKWIRGGNIFGLILDQRVMDSKEYISFFKRPVSISLLPVFILRATQCSCFFVFLSSKNYVRLIQLTGNISLKNEKVVLKRYHSVLEHLIKENPESWYGLTHKRFLIKNHNPYSS